MSADGAAALAAPAAELPGGLDAALRPLADKVRALQLENVELRRAADAEMRRVNRLLLVLAVFVSIALLALGIQLVGTARLKQDAVATQQRLDRLTSLQQSQLANLATLAQRVDEQSAEITRLTNRLQAAAPAAARQPVRRVHRRTQSR